MKLGFKNNRQSIIASTELDFVDDVVWKDAPEGFNQQTDAAIIVDGEIVIQTLEEFNQYEFGKRLRIQRLYSTPLEIEDLKKQNIEVIGLHIEPWNFTRGYKTTRNYHIDSASGDIACFVEYEYTFKDDGRQIKTIKRFIKYYDENGDIGLVQEIHAPTDRKTINSINRDVRQGRVDYLVAGAEQLKHDANNLAQIIIGLQAQENPDQATIGYYQAVVSQMNDIYESLSDIVEHYSDEMQTYVTSSLLSMSWENAILNETNPDVIEDLNKMVRLPDELFPYGLTAGQSMIHQLNGTEPSE